MPALPNTHMEIANISTLAIIFATYQETSVTLELGKTSYTNAMEPSDLGNPQGAVVDSEMRKEYHGGYTENPCTVEMPHVYSTLRRNRI